MCRRKNRQFHTHECSNAGAGCTHMLTCTAELERNFDGEPPVICPEFHLRGGAFWDKECDACAESRCPECRCVTRLEPHDANCSKNLQPVWNGTMDAAEACPALVGRTTASTLSRGAMPARVTLR